MPNDHAAQLRRPLRRLSPRQTLLGTTPENAGDALDIAVDPAASVTPHKITATIAAVDVPDNAEFVTVTLTRVAHAVDSIILHALRITAQHKAQSN